MIDDRACGQRITSMLSRNGLKQKDLALRMGVAQGIVSYWATGSRHPTLDQLVVLSDIFGVSVDYLLGLSDAPTLHPTLVDELGLSERAVGRLRDIARDPSRKAVFHKLFESDALYDLVDTLGRE